MSFTNAEYDIAEWINSLAAFVSLSVELIYFYATVRHPYLLDNPKNKMVHYLMVSNTITTLADIPHYIFSYCSFTYGYVFFSFLRNYGNVCSIMFVAALVRSSFLQLSVSRKEMLQVYQKLSMICFAFPVLWSTGVLILNVIGTPSCELNPNVSFGTNMTRLDTGVLIFGVLVYSLIHYRMIAKTLVQQAIDIGMEEMVNVRYMYKYPIILICAWIPTWIFVLLITLNSNETLIFIVYIFALTGVNLQGAINGIYYLKQNKQSSIVPKLKETMDYSLDEINIESNEKPINEEEATKKLQLALKF